MTPWCAFTIDGTTSKDLDDAINVHITPSGYLVEVYVADVAQRIPKGSRVDLGYESADPAQPGRVRGARQKVETRYLPEHNIPMIPRHLAEGKLSLLQDQPRQVMRISLTLDRTGEPTALADVAFGPFINVARLSYPDIPGILKDDTHSLHLPLQAAGYLAESLLKQREANGALVMYDLNRGWVLDEDGVLKKVDRTDATLGYVIIQELMILANRELARWCAMNDVPVLFRNHAARAHAPPRASLMADIRAAMGQGLGAIENLRQRAHMSMERARYGRALSGHYGLNLACYMHSTSPIRRYADLVSQRQVRAKVLGEALPYTGEELDEIAAEINAWKDEQVESKVAFLKARAHSEDDAKVEAQEALDRLSTTDFDRIIKVGLRAGGALPAHVRAQVEARLGADTLSTQAMMLILFEGPGAWAEENALVQAHLLQQPHKAVMVLHQAAQAGHCEEVRFKQGEAREGLFSARAAVRRGQEQIKSAWASGTRIKLAEQRAAVNLIALLTGGELPMWGSPVAAPKALPAPLQPEPPAQSDNPVAALQEWCQAGGLDLPNYTFEQSGPPHMPKIVCICVVGGAEGRGDATSKKEAKRVAAGDVVEKLRVRAAS